MVGPQHQSLAQSHIAQLRANCLVGDNQDVSSIQELLRKRGVVIEALNATICAGRGCVGEVNNGMTEPGKFDCEIGNTSFGAPNGTVVRRFDGIVDYGAVDENNAQAIMAAILGPLQ